MDEYPSNSRRPAVGPPEIDKKSIVPEERKLNKVVTGQVVHRKKSLGRRLKDTFFSSDSGNVFAYLFSEVLVPALQDVATNLVTQGIEKAVYGEVRTPHRSPTRGTPGARGTHISYDQPNRSIIRPQRPAAPPGRPIARPAAAQPSALDIGEIILADQINAQIVADGLYEALQDYESVTVANLKELTGETPQYTDYKFGWTDLSAMHIKRIREGYLLMLPEPEDLDRR